MVNKDLNGVSMLKRDFPYKIADLKKLIDDVLLLPGSSQPKGFSEEIVPAFNYVSNTYKNRDITISFHEEGFQDNDACVKEGNKILEEIQITRAINEESMEMKKYGFSKQTNEKIVDVTEDIDQKAKKFKLTKHKTSEERIEHAEEILFSSMEMHDSRDIMKRQAKLVCGAIDKKIEKEIKKEKSNENLSHVRTLLISYHADGCSVYPFSRNKFTNEEINILLQSEEFNEKDVLFMKQHCIDASNEISRFFSKIVIVHSRSQEIRPVVLWKKSMLKI